MRTELTPREIDILQWVMVGKTDWEIAIILALSRKTVNFHVEKAKRKLGQSSRVTAIAIALRDGVLAFPRSPAPAEASVAASHGSP